MSKSIIVQVTLSTIVSLMALSAHAAPKVSLSCTVADDVAAGAFYLGFSMAAGGDVSITEDAAYDQELKAYVNANFTQEDADFIENNVLSNMSLAYALFNKAQELREAGQIGKVWMSNLVKHFKDPANTLCKP